LRPDVDDRFGGRNVRGRHCYTAALAGALPARASCRVELGAGAIDGSGRSLTPGLIGAFDTAAVADETPPVISAVHDPNRGSVPRGDVLDGRGRDGRGHLERGRRADALARGHGPDQL